VEITRPITKGITDKGLREILRLKNKMYPIKLKFLSINKNKEKGMVVIV